jgi:predicted TIM-barrel fold metal-dependent hydrolase
MIIDAHAHLDESEAFGWEETVEKLLTLMNDADIAKTVITTYADTPGPENGINRLREYRAQAPDRFIAFPRMDPRWDNAVDIFERAIVEDGMSGLKLHPRSNLSPPAAQFTLELIDKAAELDVPVLFHSGDTNMSLPRQIGDAAARTDATLIMAHIGGFFNHQDALEVAREHENIVLESSASPYPRVLQEAVDELGADRVIYGSDMPPANPKAELAMIDVLDLTEEQREKILWRNIAKMLDLDVVEGGE